MSEVFDEQLSLRRLTVALKRADWRMFELGLERLAEEIEGRSPFSRHHEWQVLLKAAETTEELPDAFKTRLQDAVSRVLSVEVRIAEAPGVSEEAAAERGAIAVIAAWQHALREPHARESFRNWLAPVGARAVGTARQQLVRWLDDEGLSLETLVNRANLTLAASYGGIATGDSHWVDTLMAGLSRVLATTPARPPLTCLRDLLANHGSVSVLAAEPGLVWERHYEAEGLRFDRVGQSGALRLVKLAGSQDWFHCHACQHVSEGTSPLALAVSCVHCAAPAWPLVVPMDNPHFFPPAIRNAWARGGSLLREADTWVLLEPPAPSEGEFQRWLLESLSPAKRVLVIGSDDAVLKAWQSYLGDRQVATVVTSHGPADDVLPYLLEGGVPELKQPAAAAQAAPAFKKKNKR